MNNPSPLLPQGAIPPKAKSSVYFKILMVLGIHVVVIGGLLLQGCKETPKENKDGANPTTASTTDQTPPSNPVPAPPPTDTSTATTPTTAAVVPPPVVQPPPVTPSVPTVPTTTPATALTAPATTTPAVPAMTGGREYVVAQGDTLAAIAHKNGVSLRALEDANAGVNPKKLHVGQKLQMPAATSSAIASTASATLGATDAAPSGDAGSVYTVKPGDTLSKIAKAHGTRFKSIMEMNDLKTTSIRVGQKLKMPTRMAAVETPVASPATSTAATPAPAPLTTPATSTAAN